MKTAATFLSLLADLRRSRFARNWSYLVAANLCSQALGMVATIRIARTLAPEGYGQFNLVQTVAGLGAVLAGLGMRQVIIRECARYPERNRATFYVSTLMRAAALILVGIGIFVYGHVGQLGISSDLSGVAVGLLAGQLAWDLLESVAFGQQRMGYSAVLTLGGSLIWISAAWLSPATWLNPLTVSLAFAGLQVMKAVAYLVTIRLSGYISPQSQGESGGAAWVDTGRSLISQSAPFYWLAILTAVTNGLPALLLVARTDQAEVGLFNVGYRLLNPLQILLTTALAALYPSLARAGFGNNPHFLQTVRRAFLGITVLGTAGATAISLMRQDIVLVLFGSAYRASADAMAFQCWYTVLLSLLSLIGTGLAARDHQKRLAALSTAYTVIAFPMLWWGAGYGATGLALGMLAGAAVNMTYHWVVFQKSLPVSLSTVFGLRLVALLAAGMTLALAVPQEWPWYARLVLAMVAICACAAALAPGQLLRVGTAALPARRVAATQ